MKNLSTWWRQCERRGRLVVVLFLVLPLGCTAKADAIGRRDVAPFPADAGDAAGLTRPRPEALCAGPGADAGAPTAEAGLIDVPAGALDVPFAARLFFAFHPADYRPEAAPILVFVNGAGTSGLFMQYGTGPYSLDPATKPTAIPAPNPSSYTRFANLLYVDPRDLGFSYATSSNFACGDDAKPAIVAASDVVLAVLDFLDARPLLRDNPVAFVGESFGGVWVSLAVHLLHWGTDPGRPTPIPDVADEVPWLAGRIEQHAELAFSLCEPGKRRIAALDAQFGAQILVQPGLGGLVNRPGTSSPADLEAQDPDLMAGVAPNAQRSEYDVRLSMPEGDALDAQMAAGVHDPAKLSRILGLPVESVPRLGAVSGRGTAYRGAARAVLPGAERALSRVLGALQPGDAYYVDATECRGDFAAQVTLALAAFEQNVQHVSTLVTDDRYDPLVYTKALPAVLEQDGWQVTSPDVWDRTTVLRARPPSGADEIEIRMPAYASGHEVTIGAPREFGEDVEAWLGSLGLAAGK